MPETPSLGLNLLVAEQAQKHVTHNEALRALDAIVQLAVIDRDLTAPPGSPDDGDRYIVGASATGDWAGHDGEIAAWQDGAWAFYAPQNGWRAWIDGESVLLVWTGAAWEDFAALVTVLQNLALLGIGTTADATNPLSAKLNNILFTAKYDAEGGDGALRYKMNKESAADVLSLLLQTGFSGRAEIGLVGDDDLLAKVSPDGSTWYEALRIAKGSGKVGLGGVAAPGAGIHVKVPNGDYCFQFDDETGAYIWRGRLSGGTAFDTTLSKPMNINLSGTNGVTFIGGVGIRADTAVVNPTPSDMATGSKGLRIGDSGSSYATASVPNTKPNVFFHSFSWNGTNGFSIDSKAWLGLEQLSATNGDAKLFWKIDASFATAAKMTLDKNGNLAAVGSVAAATYAKVGTYTVATVPSASAAGAGAMIYVSDESGGAVLAFSDATNWRRVTDRAVVS